MSASVSVAVTATPWVGVVSDRVTLPATSTVLVTAAVLPEVAVLPLASASLYEAMARRVSPTSANTGV